MAMSVVMWRIPSASPPGPASSSVPWPAFDLSASLLSTGSAPAARDSAAFWSRDSQSRSHDWNDSHAESHSSKVPWDDSIAVNFFSRSSTFDLNSAANAPMVRRPSHSRTAWGV